jgi:hypothetical protein
MNLGTCLIIDLLLFLSCPPIILNYTNATLDSLRKSIELLQQISIKPLQPQTALKRPLKSSTKSRSDHASSNSLAKSVITWLCTAPANMCFRFVCIACQLTLPSFCGPPFANSTNDTPPLCRSNAHLQPTGFKCVTCERLDGGIRRLEDWAKFHAERRVESDVTVIETDSKTSVRERVDPYDARSPWYTSWVQLSALKRAMIAAGVDSEDAKTRIEAERELRQQEAGEEEIQVTASHRRDRCCFCLGNFTSLPIEATPTTEAPPGLPATQGQKRSRSPSPAPRRFKQPRKW